ncbi:hypothetical protein HYG81_01035 [Natrinema zhouii]|uniref:Uncharacterized protein n=1 Tax=Natrinema zhouii TaxID=1710539 RepID=A0A7D6GKJ2_9EURY|nr:hypothetical protein [Natrinema zhouii]QLK26239.1 hypothetical protein HYG81_01035 [Natrinema zhouii]
MSSAPSNRDWRIVVATAMVVSALFVAGCSGSSSEYTSTISDPSTGDVIDSVSVDTINQLDGARFDMDYSINATDNATYSLVVYERQNGSLEWDGVYSLDPNRYHTGVSVNPPLPDEPPATYEIRIECGENATVLDAVTVTVGVSSS